MAKGSDTSGLPSPIMVLAVCTCTCWSGCRMNADQVTWSRILRADIPSADDEPELHDLVRGSGGPTVYDKDAQLLRLHHPADAHAAHVRAYMPDVLEALQCHMDVQMGDGPGLLLQYTSTYAAKFSDQFASSWLNEEATDFQLAEQGPEGRAEKQVGLGCRCRAKRHLHAGVQRVQTPRLQYGVLGP
ncbi:unnamed protein product [Symbiodinium sp. CCMP2592]|nr:unnamed protein product [Symbiodinium sp. CCMP2592]